MNVDFKLNDSRILLNLLLELAVRLNYCQMAEILAVATVFSRESDSVAVKAWVLKIEGVQERHADLLLKNEVTGAGLLDGILKREDMERWGVPGEPAARIMQAVELAREGESRELTSLPL